MDLPEFVFGSIHPDLRSWNGKDTAKRTRQGSQRDAAIFVIKIVLRFRYIRLRCKKIPDALRVDRPVFVDLHAITFFGSYLIAECEKKQGSY